MSTYKAPVLPTVDVRGAMQGLMQANQTRGALPGQLLSQYQDRIAKEEALAAEQANKDRLFSIQKDQLAVTQAKAKRDQEIYDKSLLQEQALVDVAKDFRPYDESLGIDNTKLDAMTQGKIGLLTPGETPMVPSPDGGMMPAVDQKVYDRQAALQNLYEQQTPSQEKAYSSLLQKFVAQGADPAQGAIMAKNMASGFESDATKLANAQKQAEEYNKRAEFDAREKNKFLVKGSKGGTGSVKSYKTIYDQITADNYGNMDADDIKDIIKTVDGKIAPSRVAEMVSYFNKSGGLLTNGKFNFNKDKFKNALAEELVNPKKDKYAIGSPAIPEYSTAGDFLLAGKKSADKYNKQQFDSIFGNVPTANIGNTSTTTTTESPKKDTILTDSEGTTATEDRSTTYKNMDKELEKAFGKEISSKTNPTIVTQEELVNILNSTDPDKTGMSTAKIHTTDLNGKLLPGNVARIKNRYFETLPAESDATNLAETKDSMDAEYRRMVQEANSKKASKKKSTDPKHLLEMMGFERKVRKQPLLKQETGLPTTDEQAMSNELLGPITLPAMGRTYRQAISFIDSLPKNVVNRMIREANKQAAKRKGIFDEAEYVKDLEQLHRQYLNSMAKIR